jgi:AcrR family transcriptional regulator
MVGGDRSVVFESQDGRIARGRRTHEAILDAYELLIATRAQPPTGAELAACAGISARSVFTHFGDMDGVLASATRRAIEWVAESHVDIPRDFPLDQRLDRFVHRQAEILERTTPLARMFRAGGHGRRSRSSSPISEILSGVDRIRRRYIEDLFGRELALRSLEERGLLLEALVGSCSWNLWEGLRSWQSLNRAEASEVMRRILASLLR